MKQFFKRSKQKKILVCTNCNTKFRFPVMPGKKLNVTCPNCKATYQVSFVNPLVELVNGRLKWTALSKNEKRNLIILFITLLLCIWVVMSSFNQATPAEHQPINRELVYVN